MTFSSTKQGQFRPKLPVSKLSTLSGLSPVIFTCWPLRILKQMFGSISPEEILQRKPSIKLSSYTGDNSKGFGTIAMNWQLKTESSSKQNKDLYLSCFKVIYSLNYTKDTKHIYTRRLSRESLFWPRTTKDVENICKSCQLCQ